MAEDYLLARAAEPPSALTLGASGRDGGESTSPPSGSSVGQETPRSLSLDLAGGGAPEAADDAGPSDPSFVTEGERKWTEMRRGWLAASTSCVAAGGVKKQKGHRRASSTFEPSQLLSTKPFAKPVPLSDVVEFLLEEWETSLE